MFSIRRNHINTEDGWIQLGQTSWDWSFYDLNNEEFKSMEYFPNKQQPDAIFENIFIFIFL